jgi:glutamate racemase
MGDNGRAPYGNRSFETVHQYTLECVQWFFDMGCPLVILACNTASAKALRTIQQRDLPGIDPKLRVLGVIRPTAEVIGNYTQSKEVGVLGTRGTVLSDSYKIEISHFFPEVKVHQKACPIWVPLIENGEHTGAGADFFVQKYLNELMSAAPGIDTVLLACTHYPLIADKIKQYLPPHVQVVAQGDIVAASLADYLTRHPEIDNVLTRGGTTRYFTTDDTTDFDNQASVFLGKPVTSEHVPVATLQR